jgi:hypothetical protein
MAIVLPLIATLSHSPLSPPSNHGDQDDKMYVDGLRSSLGIASITGQAVGGDASFEVSSCEKYITTII